MCAGKDAIVREIEGNDVVVLLGETGSGKTTRMSAIDSQVYPFIGF